MQLKESLEEFVDDRESKRLHGRARYCRVTDATKGSDGVPANGIIVAFAVAAAIRAVLDPNNYSLCTSMQVHVSCISLALQQKYHSVQSVHFIAPLPLTASIYYSDNLDIDHKLLPRTYPICNFQIRRTMQTNQDISSRFEN